MVQKFSYKEVLTSAKLNGLVDAVNGNTERVSSLTTSVSAINEKVGGIESGMLLSDSEYISTDTGALITITQTNGGSSDVDIPLASAGGNGLMSVSDKAKLDALSLTDGNGTIDASVLSGFALYNAEYTTNGYGAQVVVTQANGGSVDIDLPLATDSDNGLMSFTDVRRLTRSVYTMGINEFNEKGIEIYFDDNTDESHYFTIPLVDKENNNAGLMSAADKEKLDNLSVSGTIDTSALEGYALYDATYTSNEQGAQIIVTQGNGGSADIDLPLATDSQNGLMSVEDKRNLDTAMDNILGGTDVHAEADYVTIDVHGPLRRDGSYESYEGNIPAATQSEAGVMTASDKQTLDNLNNTISTLLDRIAQLEQRVALLSGGGTSSTDNFSINVQNDAVVVEDRQMGDDFDMSVGTEQNLIVEDRIPNYGFDATIDGETIKIERV